MAGRPKGVPNKATTEAREAIARLVDGNAHRMSIWLEEIYKTKGPEAAWRCMTDVIEYHMPKLARTEHIGDKDKPVAMHITWREPQ